MDGARLKAGTAHSLVENYFFAALFNRETGIYAWKHTRPVWVMEDGQWVRYRRRLRRREWIETYMRIQTKSGKTLPLKLNATQRQVECMMLRLERLGLPVRITLAKARQLGLSTYVEAVAFYEMMTSSQTKVLLVGDNKDRAKMLLEIANIARNHMPKTVDSESGEEVPWKFRMRSKARYTLEWDEPLSSQIVVASAEEPEPGQGGTRRVVHLSESASNSYTQEKIGNILPSLPTLPGTYGFNESTPNGGSGWFFEVFMSSWREREQPLLERKHPWIAMFFPSWSHAEYVWTKTYGYGRELTDTMRAEISRTLSKDEEWILRQRYMRRWTPDDEWQAVSLPGGGVKWSRVGVGPCSVDLDHIAWRRSKIGDAEIHGDIDLFNQEYAKDPETMFLSSGRPVYDRAILMEMVEKCVEPWRGDIDLGQEALPEWRGLEWNNASS